MPYLPVELSDGSTIEVEYFASGPTQKSLLDKQKFSKVITKISGLIGDIKKAVEDAAPDKATVEIGIDIGVKDGELTAFFVKGEANTSFKLTLEWNKKSA